MARDWGGLGAIYKEAQENFLQESLKPPEACPYDGSPLDERDGIRNCPMGDYCWRGW